jgi:hypothetical protein
MCMCAWGDQSCVCVLEVISHVYVCLRWAVMCMCAWGDQSCVCVLEVISHVCVLEVISHVYVYLRWSVMCMCAWGDQSCVCVLEVISHVYVCLSYLFCLYFYNFSINFLTCFRQCGSFCFSLYTGVDPGFQVWGGALKKIAPSGGNREHFWGISCEKSWFYAKNSYFFQF